MPVGFKLLNGTQVAGTYVVQWGYTTTTTHGNVQVTETTSGTVIDDNVSGYETNASGNLVTGLFTNTFTLTSAAQINIRWTVVGKVGSSSNYYMMLMGLAHLYKVA